jgi:hypothetical protein
VIAENGRAVGTAFYAAVMTLCGIALAGVWLHALRAGLVRSSCSASDRRRILIASLVVPAVFGASIPLSFFSPDGAKFFWLLIIPLNPIARWLSGASTKRSVA